MSVVEAIRWIGVSHLLQPPLTWLLASSSGLGLRAELTARTRIGAAVVQNMAFASVVLPTALGLLLAVHAPDALRAGAAQSLGLLLAGFWSWRLVRQLTALRVAWPAAPRLAAWSWHGLVVIFGFQGPILALLLATGRATP